jgi:hypothetical protein
MRFTKLYLNGKISMLVNLTPRVRITLYNFNYLGLSQFKNSARKRNLESGGWYFKIQG